jgi:hypothetical protein
VLYPLQSFSVKHSEVAVVLFSIIASKHEELLVVKRGSMILYLWCTKAFIVAALATYVIDVLAGLPTHHWMHG